VYRDTPCNIADLPELKAQLHRESVRMHGDEIVRRATARMAA
jgi:hypothetical protein